MLDPLLGDEEWILIRRASEGYIDEDPEPFRNPKDEKYTFRFICEGGFVECRERYMEIALKINKQVELSKNLAQLELFWNDAKISNAFHNNHPDLPIIANN